MSEGFDQFTRWLCPKCGQAGIDSWNKAMFDGVAHLPVMMELPDPWILGDQCSSCLWPAALRYTKPDAAPRAIFGPNPFSNRPGVYAYEIEAMNRLQDTPDSGELLRPSDKRDADWSRGCLAAKGQLQ
jgi:hypothetical protein